MFVDSVKITVKGGSGGNGAISFRREKYVPRGGPDGGDGGKGGDVVLAADSQVSTLVHLASKKHFAAESGSPGEGSNRSGKNGSDLVIKVPVGTLVKDPATGKVIGDLSTPQSTVVAAKGGEGGRGNARFANPRRQAPRIAEKGAPGEQLELELELKLISDVGIIGFPNAGKSTLLSRISAARPKIADYPFTTLEPNLGVVSLGEGVSFVVADIPGLMEGAHEGVGLGHRFLRHIERTRLLIHLIDVSPLSLRDPVDDYRKINEELRLYSASLSRKPQVVAANKTDLPGSAEACERLRRHLSRESVPVFPISAVTGEGVTELLYAVSDRLKRVADTQERDEESRMEVIYRPDRDEVSVRREDGVFVVAGGGLERKVALVDLDNLDALRYVQSILRGRGVIEKLKEAGVSDGDTVRVGDTEFVYSDETAWQE